MIKSTKPKTKLEKSIDTKGFLFKDNENKFDLVEDDANDSNDSDREDYRKLKKEVKGKVEKKKKNIGEVLGTLLKKKTSNFK
jgi:hypothetical protein